MKLKTFVYLAIVGVASSLTTSLTYQWAGYTSPQVVIEESKRGQDVESTVELIKTPGKVRAEVPEDFTYAAQKTTPSVVHIIATKEVNASNRTPQMDGMPDMFRDFFDNFGTPDRGPRQSQGSGSGVIISQDGYIVTNNHVVEDATTVEVVLNDKSTFEAEIIGTDPSTDLAVIKVKAKGLRNIVLGNSDNVKVGQWVLAVGNPFNLESTVTAGIVSAKGRNLNLLRNKDQVPVESFIQTDAAVNPGNSGGALINPEGELIGINTAIATPTGTYAGYSFAVPINLVRKVMKDLIEHGSVQRAYLGVEIRQVDGKFADEQGLKDITEGVYVNKVNPGGAAAEAGVQAGDVIIGVDDRPIKSSPELLEEIAKRRPGNKITLKVLRNGASKDLSVFLKGGLNGEKVATNVKDDTSNKLRTLGIELEELKPEELKELGLENGVRISRIYEGKIKRETNIREGFIVTKSNNKPVKSAEDFLKTLPEGQGGVFLIGRYPDLKDEYYYAFGM